MEKVKTIFIGTSSFAVPVLEKLMDLDFIDLTSIITQPDRPTGRKQILTPPPVKEILNTKFETLNIKVYQPEKIKKEYKEILEKENPELIIVASYGQILPQELLEFPKYGTLNLHVSLLPELRGAVPMQMAILSGLKKTGVTLQKMVYALDEGPIISAREIPLDKDETFASLEAKSAEISSQILEEDLPKWINGEIEATPQDESMATYCSIKDTTKDKAEITFDTDVEVAERMIRAFETWPVSWITLQDGKYKDKRLKIYKAKLDSQRVKESENQNSLLITQNSKRLFLHLHDGVLELLEIQLEGKKRMEAKEYLFIV